MPITFETGDLFATPEVHGFAHGCNCAGAMGKGIAVAFRERWPAMYAEYRRRCKSSKFNPGDVFVWKQEADTVFNLGTQKSWTAKAVLTDVESALTAMVREAEARGIPRIALPRIGAGLGGLPWEEVRPVMERIGGETATWLRVCDVFVPGRPLAAGREDLS